MNLKLNDKQVVILKGLLDNEADVKGLKEELANCKELLNQLK